MLVCYFGVVVPEIACSIAWVKRSILESFSLSRRLLLSCFSTEDSFDLL